MKTDILPNTEDEICQKCLQKVTENYKKLYPEKSEKTVVDSVAMLAAMLTIEELGKITRFGILGIFAILKEGGKEMYEEHFKKYMNMTIEIGFKEVKKYQN